MENGLKRWQEENNRLTKEECHRLLRSLKEQHLDPILRQLSGKEGASVTFAQIIGGYSAIEQGFKSHSRGAKDVCAQVFYEFHPVCLIWHIIIQNMQLIHEQTKKGLSFATLQWLLFVLITVVSYLIFEVSTCQIFSHTLGRY